MSDEKKTKLKIIGRIFDGSERDLNDISELIPNRLVEEDDKGNILSAHRLIDNYDGSFSVGNETPFHSLQENLEEDKNRSREDKRRFVDNPENYDIKRLIDSKGFRHSRKSYEDLEKMGYGPSINEGMAMYPLIGPEILGVSFSDDDGNDLDLQEVRALRAGLELAQHQANRNKKKALGRKNSPGTKRPSKREVIIRLVKVKEGKHVYEVIVEGSNVGRFPSYREARAGARKRLNVERLPPTQKAEIGYSPEQVREMQTRQLKKDSGEKKEKSLRKKRIDKELADELIQHQEEGRKEGIINSSRAGNLAFRLNQLNSKDFEDTVNLLGAVIDLDFPKGGDGKSLDSKGSRNRRIRRKLKKANGDIRQALINEGNRQNEPNDILYRTQLIGTPFSVPYYRDVEEFPQEAERSDDDLTDFQERLAGFIHARVGRIQEGDLRARELSKRNIDQKGFRHSIKVLKQKAAIDKPGAKIILDLHRDLRDNTEAVHPFDHTVEDLQKHQELRDLIDNELKSGGFTVDEYNELIRDSDASRSLKRYDSKGFRHSRKSFVDKDGTTRFTDEDKWTKEQANSPSQKVFESEDFGSSKINEEYFDRLINSRDDRNLSRGVNKDQYLNALDEDGEVLENYKTDRIWKPIDLNRNDGRSYYEDPRIEDIRKEIVSMIEDRSNK